MAASIFNDVIGPVMRGPSSSHVAGAARIGDLIRQSQRGDLEKVRVYFDPKGSLAESHDGHGSDMGFVSGLLGLGLTDPSVPMAVKIAREKGPAVEFIIKEYGAVHPNNYRIEAEGAASAHSWDAISVGGGMVRMEFFDGFPVSIEGGYFEYLLTLAPAENLMAAAEAVKAIARTFERIDTETLDGKALINLKTAAALPRNAFESMKTIPGVTDIVFMEPILPTRAKADCAMPFLSAAELFAYSQKRPMEFWKYAALYESIRGNTTSDAVFKQMSELLAIMENCIEEGLAGTQYDDRILGPQANKIAEAARKGSLIPNDMNNRIITYITAIMEVKSAMGVIQGHSVLPNLTSRSAACLFSARTSIPSAIFS
ncbi:MAG: hypothetical protein LBP61_06870 [Desulfovibrio sp.]|jgi:L-serine dehydratase|nr:hypothetical protein [Desulfovibrio sp.]